MANISNFSSMSSWDDLNFSVLPHELLNDTSHTHAQHEDLPFTVLFIFAGLLVGGTLNLSHNWLV